jgi:L-seryl-tRNA(Ser) seleniumtransferase
LDQKAASLSRIPSVDEVLRTDAAAAAIARYGRISTVAAVRVSLDGVRTILRSGQAASTDIDDVAASALAKLEVGAQPNVRPVFNLTGTVLHTNLGRAILAEAAAEAASVAMRHALALEFNLETGHRGERDELVRGLLCELTGAEDATVVNNNAAAVLLVLNTLANGKHAVVSRGELIEIGGAFRMPDIMARAGTKLVEVGTTNRTHLKDYQAAIGAKTGLMLKVHTSNYRIEGFTKEVQARELAALARKCGVPMVHDLGSGTLVDLSRYGLAHEPTVAESVADGADVITFSGDKLLGGPQAGFIVGRKDIIAKVNRNPMKRALRIDKIRLAALEATLRLYRDPDRLEQRLPTIRMLARPKKDIEALAHRVLPAVGAAIGGAYSAAVVSCSSQIGSGALPVETLASAGIACRAIGSRSGRALDCLATAFRRLPIPMIGRIESQTLILDLRCLDDEETFMRNLAAFKLLEPE